MEQLGATVEHTESGATQTGTLGTRTGLAIIKFQVLSDTKVDRSKPLELALPLRSTNCILLISVYIYCRY